MTGWVRGQGVVLNTVEGFISSHVNTVSSRLPACSACQHNHKSSPQQVITNTTRHSQAQVITNKSFRSTSHHQHNKSFTSTSHHHSQAQVINSFYTTGHLHDAVHLYKFMLIQEQTAARFHDFPQ
jgi:hypothetical protein